MAQDVASLESYGARTDWASVAATYPKLAACTATFKGETGVDWTRPEARAVVAEALLRHDFGITYHAAPGHLVPCVPNRVRYVAWAAKVAGDGVTSAPASQSPFFATSAAASAHALSSLSDATTRHF